MAWQHCSSTTPESNNYTSNKIFNFLLTNTLSFFSPQMIIEKVIESKKAEIIAGVDGFMVYDLKLVPYMNKVRWQHCLSTSKCLYVHV